MADELQDYERRHLSIAVWLSVVTATPYLLYEVWRFVEPALYPHERRGVSKALLPCASLVFCSFTLFFVVMSLKRQRPSLHIVG